MNEQTLLNTMITLLSLAALIAVIYFYWEGWRMEQDMKRIQERERDTEPQPYTPDREHISRVLAEVRSLRTPLKSYKNMEHAAQAIAVEFNDRASCEAAAKEIRRQEETGKQVGTILCAAKGKL